MSHEPPDAFADAKDELIRSLHTSLHEAIEREKTASLAATHIEKTLIEFLDAERKAHERSCQELADRNGALAAAYEENLRLRHLLIREADGIAGIAP